MSGIAIASSRHSVGVQHKTWHRLCSKRFQGIMEQRKTKEQDFQHFACMKNGARAKEKGDEGGPSFTCSNFSCGTSLLPNPMETPAMQAKHGATLLPFFAQFFIMQCPN